jgi:serine/threonine protein kinase
MASCPSRHQSLVMAHVLFVDIVESSMESMDRGKALVAQFQQAIQRTSEYQRASACNELIFQTTGHGGVLVFLRNPEAPVRCAIELNKEFGTNVRMGIHSGPVCILEGLNRGDTDVLGEGINTAERVADCGGSRHILLSGDTAKILGHPGKWADVLHDLGEAEVKQGMRVHLFNLYAQGIGNPDPPKCFKRGLDTLIGEVVGHFHIERNIGGGGMGVVYEAADTDLHRPVALKFLPEDLSREARYLARFQKEARAVAALNHPNICTIYELGSFKGRSFIAMELLQGNTLTSLIKSRQLTPEESIKLAIEIADGLDAAHGRGIVHRDIKSSNIFVTGTGHAKILDFGVVKWDPPRDPSLDSTVSEPRDTSAGQLVGTIPYMSPEQLRSRPIDSRTDLFSFGVVLYEMATGTLPFSGNTDPEIYDAILNRAPAPYSLRPDFPRGIERIINRALEKDPQRRYASAAEMRDELKLLLERKDPELPSISPVRAGATRAILLYRRNVPLDEQLLELLERKLVREGYQVFIDRHLQIGMHWAKEIQHRIASADVVIPLLSSASVQSEMLGYEIQLAYEYAQKQQGKPRILPIRVNLTEAFPAHIAAILDGIQYGSWNGPEDDERLLDGLLSAIQHPGYFEPQPPRPAPANGAMPLDCRFYIVRSTDDDFLSAITRQDSIVLVKGARQMGKTSLMARGLQLARQNGNRVILTDFQKLNSNNLESTEGLFRVLAESIADQLDYDLEIDSVWNTKRGPSVNFERFLRRQIFPKVGRRLVWAMDEVDRLFSCTFASEVFGLFRSWHNERSLDPTGPWQTLTLAIAYATEAHMFITDINQSPFNVGTRLSLADFTLEQFTELNERYGNPLRDANQIAACFKLLGGQPYLSNRGLNQMASHRIDFWSFEAQACRDEGPFGDHLRRILFLLAQDPALCNVMRSVLSGRNTTAPEQFYRLRSAGIVAGESAREMQPRCELYARYLSQHLM